MELDLLGDECQDKDTNYAEDTDNKAGIVERKEIERGHEPRMKRALSQDDDGENTNHDILKGSCETSEHNQEDPKRGIAPQKRHCAKKEGKGTCDGWDGDAPNPTGLDIDHYTLEDMVDRNEYYLIAEALRWEHHFGKGTSTPGARDHSVIQQITRDGDMKLNAVTKLLRQVVTVVDTGLRLQGNDLEGTLTLYNVKVAQDSQGHGILLIDGDTRIGKEPKQQVDGKSTLR